jgi:hypothetical protein
MLNCRHFLNKRYHAAFSKVQGGNINASDAPPASTGEEIGECKVT